MVLRPPEGLTSQPDFGSVHQPTQVKYPDTVAESINVLNGFDLGVVAGEAAPLSGLVG